MKRFAHDKYGRGSAAANGEGFVDLAPGDTYTHSVEALEINEDTDSERTPRGAMPKGLNPAPFQNLVSQLVDKIAYYVGDVKRTRPSFVGVANGVAFSVEAAAQNAAALCGGGEIE